MRRGDPARNEGQLAGENMGGGNKRFGGSEEDCVRALFGFALLARAKK
jgi:hypothetical protein